MNQREYLINQYKFILGNKSKSIQSRINTSLLVIVVMSIAALVSFLLILFCMLVDWFDLNFKPHWDNAALFVTSSILILSCWADNIYGYVLLKHLKRIQYKEPQIKTEAINKELEQIITKRPYSLYNKFILVFGLLIFIVAFGVVMSSSNVMYLKFWSYFKIPVLLFYFLYIKQIIKNLILIKRNNILFELACIKQ